MSRTIASHIRLTLIALGLLLLAGLSTPAVAQMGGGASNPELQQKTAALKQSAAENKQTSASLPVGRDAADHPEGRAEAEKVFQCSYGPNGQVHEGSHGRSAAGSPEERQLRERVVEKKTDEMKEYMQQVQSLLSMYVPPNPQLIQQAMQKHNVSIDKTMGSPLTNIVFKNYAKARRPDDVGFDTAAKKIATINVNTYMDKPGDAVTLAVQMGACRMEPTTRSRQY